MLYHSTNGKATEASLRKAVIKGLAEDKGLYMPSFFPKLDEGFFEHIHELTFPDIAAVVAKALFGEDVPEEALECIARETVSFDCPVKDVSGGIWSLELFHGPTLAFKDVGARFMARLLSHFIEGDSREVNVLVATSGDTGGAVANGFLGVPGIRVFVLYPKGKVSHVQECQFTTLGRNVTAIEVDGVFDDCQALVKEAFMDVRLNAEMRLTSANSINVARLFPQTFYYFNAYARLREMGRKEAPVVCVPSGNFGNICAAMIASRMGLPVKRFVAANNRNDVFLQFLRSGKFVPKPSVQTLANAMDVGNPSNFARIWELYGHDWKSMLEEISGEAVSDGEILETIRTCHESSGYLLDPHGACGYHALSSPEVGLTDGEVGFFCETAHPAKFQDTVERAISAKVELPERLAAFTKGNKNSVPMGKDFPAFRDYLLSAKR